MKTSVVALLLLGMVALSSGACSLSSCTIIGITCEKYIEQLTCLKTEASRCTSSETIKKSAIDASIKVLESTIAGLNNLGQKCEMVASSGACSLSKCNLAGTTCDNYVKHRDCLNGAAAKCTSSQTAEKAAIDTQILAMNAAIKALNDIGQKCGSAAISASVTVLIVGVLAAIFKK